MNCFLYHLQYSWSIVIMFLNKNRGRSLYDYTYPKINRIWLKKNFFKDLKEPSWSPFLPRLSKNRSFLYLINQKLIPIKPKQYQSKLKKRTAVLHATHFECHFYTYSINEFILYHYTIILTCMLRII